MRILLTSLLFILSLHTSGQRYFLDSLGVQNGYKVIKPRNLIEEGSMRLHFISDTGNNNVHHLMYLEDNKTHFVADSFNNANIAGDFQMIQHASYTYYTLFDNTNGYKLYRYKSNGNKQAPKLINTNYPGLFRPLQGLNSLAGRIYIFNDSAGHLQLLAFNHSTLLIESVINLGQYKAVNTKLCKAGPVYFNMINGQNVELLCRFTPMVVPQPTIEIVDTISINNSSLRLSALYWYDSCLYYAAHDSTHGYELTAINMWTNKIKRLTDIAPGALDGIYSDHLQATFGGAYNKILFTASTAPGTLGYQLYSYDPSTDSVKLVHTLTNTVVNGSINASCNNFTNYYGLTYFTAYSGTERILWRYEYVDTPEVVTFPGVAKILNGNNFNWRLSSGNNLPPAMCLYFIGENDGVEKIYKIYDTTTIVSVKSVNKNDISIALYPNPTTQDAYLDIHLDKAQTFSLQLTDMQGRIVYKNEVKLYSQGQHKLTIPMQQLANGTYIYTVSDGNGILLNSGKLLKQ